MNRTMKCMVKIVENVESESISVYQLRQLDYIWNNHGVGVPRTNSKKYPGHFSAVKIGDGVGGLKVKISEK